jgi:hypothetical protein
MPLPSEMLAYQTRCVKELMKHYLIHYKRKYPNWVQQETEALQRRKIEAQFRHMGQAHLRKPAAARPHHQTSSPLPAHTSNRTDPVSTQGQLQPTRGQKLGEVQQQQQQPQQVTQNQQRRVMSRTNSNVNVQLLSTARFQRSLSVPVAASSAMSSSTHRGVVPTVAMRSLSRSASPIAHVLTASQDSGASLGTAAWINSNEDSRDSFRDSTNNINMSSSTASSNQSASGNNTANNAPPMVPPRPVAASSMGNDTDTQMHAQSLMQFASPPGRNALSGMCSPFLPNSAAGHHLVAPLSAASFSNVSFAGRPSTGMGGGLHAQGQQLQRQLAALVDDPSVEMPSLEHTTMFPSTAKKQRTKKRRRGSDEDEEDEEDSIGSEEKENEDNGNNSNSNGSTNSTSRTDAVQHKRRQFESGEQSERQQVCTLKQIRTPELYVCVVQCYSIMAIQIYIHSSFIHIEVYIHACIHTYICTVGAQFCSVNSSL